MTRFRRSFLYHLGGTSLEKIIEGGEEEDWSNLRRGEPSRKPEGSVDGYPYIKKRS